MPRPKRAPFQTPKNARLVTVVVEARKEGNPLTSEEIDQKLDGICLDPSIVQIIRNILYRIGRDRHAAEPCQVRSPFAA